MIRLMFRAVLVSALCVVIASLGVAGLHVHVPDGHHADHADHAHDGGSAHLTTLLHHDHAADHDEEGDVDIEPMSKAFGKPSLSTPALAAVLTLLFVLALYRGLTLFLRVESAPLRPPRPQLSPHFLPPSHAPPASAFAR
jgi:hypothetical protein